MHEVRDGACGTSPQADYTRHWDEKFASRPWGRYPPEDLVRFMGRAYREADKAAVHVLEVGCGPGANLWFLHREGYAVHGIDASPAAIELARRRLLVENGHIAATADLRVGNFARLPWGDARFDAVIDVFALYANTSAVIDAALAEIARVLRPGGRLYSKLWGSRTTGFGEGHQIEPGTFDAIPRGPCRDMGVTHFFVREEIEQVFGRHLRPVVVDTVLRTDVAAGYEIEEFHCQLAKPG